jgi:hypothetical protein
MDIEKSSYRDRTVVFTWNTEWRPRQLEEADNALGLPSARTRDQQLVRGYILGAAIDSGRRDPEQWLSYSRNHNYYANQLANDIGRSTICMPELCPQWINSLA